VLHRRAQPIHPCLALLRLCTYHAQHLKTASAAMIAREQAMVAQRSVLEAANAAHQLAQQLDEVKRSNSKLHGRCLELFAQLTILTKVKARIADLEIRLLSADAFAPYARRRARVVSQCVGTCTCSWLRRAAATNCGVLSGGPCGLYRRRVGSLVCFTCVLDSQGLGGGALTKRSSAIGIRSTLATAPGATGPPLWVHRAWPRNFMRHAPVATPRASLAAAFTLSVV
jgi:hypothetical protein